MDDGEEDFPGQLLPSESSLKFGEEIARQLGQPFDREEVREAARTLHKRYFEAILRANGLNLPISFRSGTRYQVTAFVPAYSESVFLDEMLDHWLASLCHLNTVAACFSLTGARYAAVRGLFGESLDLLDAISTERWIEVREKHRPYVLDFAPGLELSHALGRAMTVFVLCHEIAHIEAGHAEQEITAADELEADARATELFLGVHRAGLDAPPIFIHEKLVGAPLLLFQFLGMHERHSRLPPADSHPSAAQRFAQASARLAPIMTPAAHDVLYGFTQALGDMERLGLS